MTLRFSTKCSKCDLEIPAIQDMDDATKFHIDCPVCGESKTLTAVTTDGNFRKAMALDERDLPE